MGVNNVNLVNERVDRWVVMQLSFQWKNWPESINKVNLFMWIDKFVKGFDYSVKVILCHLWEFNHGIDKTVITTAKN